MAPRERPALVAIVLLVVLLCWCSERFLRGAAAFPAGGTALLGWWALGRLPRRRPGRPDPAYRPFVTLVIPARDEERVVAGAVLAALAQDYRDAPRRPRFEVLAVDDRSADGTPAVLRALQRRHPELRLLTRPADASGGKGAALADALLHCRGEVIAYLDADARVAADFLRRVVPHLADARVAAAQCRKRTRAEGGLLARLQADESALVAALQRDRAAGGGAVDLMGNGMLVKRHALEQAGGWDREALTEDLDLGTRLHVRNWEVAYAGEAVVWEEPAGCWAGLARQRLRWAEGSYRRYCRYFWALLGPSFPLGKRLDACNYLAGWVLPLWLLGDGLAQLARGGPFDPHLAVFAVVATALLAPALLARGLWLAGERRAVVRRSVVAACYLLLWLPVVLAALARIAWRGRPSAWVKSEHSLALAPALAGER